MLETRRFPTAHFVVDISQGLSASLLRLVVKTANGAGIAAGQPILVDGGSGYVAKKVDDDEPSSKRFRGALDKFFGANGSEVPAPKGPPAAPKPPPPQKAAQAEKALPVEKAAPAGKAAPAEKALPPAKAPSLPPPTEAWHFVLCAEK